MDSMDKPRNIEWSIFTPPQWPNFSPPLTFKHDFVQTLVIASFYDAKFAITNVLG